MATVKDRYQLEVDVRNASSALRNIQGVMKAFAGVIAVRELVQFGRTIIDTTSQLQTLSNSLRLVTNDTADLARLQGVLRDTAVQNRTAFAETVDLFVKLRVSTEALGVSEQRVINVTSKLSQALQVAGADAATTNAVIRQFGQAMASGEVRGDEFRSIVEGLGPALAIMARESGLNVGELRKMSREGKLTAEVMFEMFEKSKALTQAFETMAPTLSQLETRFKDAFDLFIVKIGEATGFTQAYQKLILELTRQMEDFAGDTVRDMSMEEIMKGSKEGTIQLQEAIDEVKRRYLQLLDLGPLDLLTSPIDTVKGLLTGEIHENRNAYKLLLEQLEKLKKTKEDEAQRAKDEIAAYREQQEALAELLLPHKKYIDQAKKYAETDYRTELEKTNDRIRDAKKVIEELNIAQEKSNGQVDNFNKLLKAAQDELTQATEKLKKLEEEAKKDIKLEGYEKFYDDLVKTSKEIVDTRQYIIDAEKQLLAEFEKGAITSYEYAQALELLMEAKKRLNGDILLLERSTYNFIESMKDGTRDLQQELDTLNMTPLEKQLADIENTLTRDMNRQIEAIYTQVGNFPMADIKAQVKAVKDATMQQIEEQKKLAKRIHEEQRSFEYGWKKAFESYEDDATNAAKAAERIFRATTQGMEDMIVNFAKTGKFEFKGFINSVLEDLLRSQVQQIMAKTFGMLGKGGGAGLFTQLGSLLGFANGGIIPTNSPVMVGEKGPELLLGASGNRVIPNSELGMGGNVTYNINAVDARSFKELIAADPSFIHSVAVQGSKTAPGRR